MPRKIYEPWITIRSFALPNNTVCQGAVLSCDHCHRDMQIMLPEELNNLLALASAFGNIHNHCLEELSVIP